MAAVIRERASKTDVDKGGEDNVGMIRRKKLVERIMMKRLED